MSFTTIEFDRLIERHMLRMCNAGKRPQQTLLEPGNRGLVSHQNNRTVVLKAFEHRKIISSLDLMCVLNVLDRIEPHFALIYTLTSNIVASAKCAHWKKKWPIDRKRVSSIHESMNGYKK